MDRKKMYNVKNRSASVIVVRIPDLNYRKEFAPGETTRMSFEEIEKLNYQPGGKELIGNFLQIMEDEVTDTLGVPREAEYYMNEQQIVDMLRSGSLDQLKDCLDFAPIGVIDLVKQLSIALPLTDTQKIQAIKNKTGFDVEQALRNMAEEKESDETTENTANTAPKATGRRTTPNYKVVSKG